MEIQELVEKHKEALKDLMDELIKECIQLFESRIPEQIMKSSVGTLVIYNTVLNLLCRLASVSNRDLEEIKLDITQVWYAIKKPEIEESEAN